ncbi:MAG: hypothetical protein H0U98_12510 [Alphaproteobacteria bacterium]|nr:hypothetical protein [Alphaproteobacteria bacterium]
MTAMIKPIDSPELKCIVYAACLAALALVINIQESGPAACAIMQKPLSTRCETLFGSNLKSETPSAPAPARS